MEMTDVSNKKSEWKKKKRHVSYTDRKRRLALANTNLGSSDSKRFNFDWKISIFTWWWICYHIHYKYVFLSFSKFNRLKIEKTWGKNEENTTCFYSKAFIPNRRFCSRLSLNQKKLQILTFWELFCNVNFT